MTPRDKWSTELVGETGRLLPADGQDGRDHLRTHASRGIDIIRVDRPKKLKAMPTVTAPILAQWHTPTVAPDPVFGFACPLPL